MLDVGVHDAAAGGGSKDEYVRKSAKFGIRTDHKRMVIPTDQVARITRLGDAPRRSRRSTAA